MDSKENTDVESHSRKDDKKIKKKRNKTVFHEWFHDFTERSTIQGFQYLSFKKVSLFEKIFWIVTIIISVVLCTLLIYDVWWKWKNSPVIVSFKEKLVPVGSVPFPSVTICPHTKFRKSVYDYAAEMKYYTSYIQLLLEDGKAINSTVTRRIEKLKNVNLLCGEWFNERYGPKRGNRTIINDILEVSMDLDNIFFGCVWRGIDTECKNIFKRVMTSEGVCFNFNSLSAKDLFNNEKNMNYNYLDEGTPVRGWSEDGYADDVEDPYPNRGRDNGAQPDLRVMFKIDDSERDGLCNTLNRGFKVFLQHPKDRPKTSFYAYEILPTRKSSMAITYSMLTSSSKLKKYPPDLRQCYFSSERKLRYYRTYSATNCQSECRANYTYEKCGCVWFNMPFNDSEHFCTSESIECVNSAKDDLVSSDMRDAADDKCHCLPSCNSIKYDADVLESFFDMKTFIINTFALMNYTFEESFFENKSFSRLDMFFKESRTVAIRRSELFGTTDFLANCGGILGLFLGFSFLSIIEVFYFLTIRLCCMLRKNNIPDLRTQELKPVEDSKTKKQ